MYGNSTSRLSVPLPSPPSSMYDFESACESPCCTGAVHPSGKVTNTFQRRLQRAWCNLLFYIASALLLAIFVWGWRNEALQNTTNEPWRMAGPKLPDPKRGECSAGRWRGGHKRKKRERRWKKELKKYKEDLTKEGWGREDKENASRDALCPPYGGLTLGYYLLCSYVTSVKISDSACRGIYIMLTHDSSEPVASLPSPLRGW